MLNITFQQMEAFLTVGTYSNLSKAAEALFISQSALSRMLQRFEEGLDMQLFTRSNQGLSFTEEGQFLFMKMSSLYQSINNAVDMAKNISTTQTKTLNIVAPSSYDATTDFNPLREIVKGYSELYPDVVLNQTLYDFDGLRRMLELGEAELAFAQDFSVEDMKGISYKRISRFEICLAISVNHRIVEREDIDFSLLQNDLYFTVPMPGSGQDISHIIQRCRRLGFMPKGLVFVPNFQTLVYNIRHNKGISLCGRFDMLNNNDIRYYPLPEPLNHAYVVVAWQNRKLSLHAKNFIKMLPEGEVLVNP